MIDIWTEELAHLTKGMHASIVHHCTSRFIISQVKFKIFVNAILFQGLPLCEQVYQGGDDTEGLLNELLMNKFAHLVHFQRRPSNLEKNVDGDELEEEEVANV